MNKRYFLAKLFLTQPFYNSPIKISLGTETGPTIQIEDKSNEVDHWVSRDIKKGVNYNQAPQPGNI